MLNTVKSHVKVLGLYNWGKGGISAGFYSMLSLSDGWSQECNVGICRI